MSKVAEVALEDITHPVLVVPVGIIHLDPQEEEEEEDPDTIRAQDRANRANALTTWMAERSGKRTTKSRKMEDREEIATTGTVITSSAQTEDATTITIVPAHKSVVKPVLITGDNTPDANILLTTANK